MGSGAETEAEALDRAVAERVLGMVPCDGWTPTNLGSAGGPALMKECTHPAGTCYPAARPAAVLGHRGGPRRYSSAVSAAWEVVERFGDAWSIAVSRDDGVRASVVRQGRSYEASAAFLPRAVCLAALKAIEGHE